MSEQRGVISSRRACAEQRLAALGSRIGELEALNELPGSCIYVTGSFGRLEASEYSDLDLFFVHEGSSIGSPMSRVRKILLDADLIRAARELNFPEFSNDGEYLAVHYLDDVLNTLGGPDDDFRNHFTARLLLLLESRPLYNVSVYEHALEKIVDSYYRDYHGHETSFRPVFLMNDVMRFWRTLCLNYEHRRNRPDDDEERKRKNHVANLKLKFSRMLTCYSAVVLLSIEHARHAVEPCKLLEIIRLSPLERLGRVVDIVPGTKQRVTNVKEVYSWFLEETARDRDDMLRWISDSGNRNKAFGKGREFANEMYQLIRTATEETEIMRFLVV